VLASGGSLTYGQMATPAGLRDIAKYADIASPSKDYIVPRDAAGRSLPPTTFIRDAHQAGLDVVAYAFRVENSFLPLELRSSANPADSGNLFAEIKQFFAPGFRGAAAALAWRNEGTPRGSCRVRCSRGPVPLPLGRRARPALARVSVAAFAALGYAIGRWWAMAIAVLLVVPSALFAAVLDSPGFSALCLIAPLITAVGARASLASHRAYANAE